MKNQLPFSFSPTALEQFCKRYHIQKFALFGSVLREDFRPHSDVDVLVEFEEGMGPGFIALYDIEQELSKLVGGRSIDLITFNALNPLIRTEVLSEARTLYEEN